MSRSSPELFSQPLTVNDRGARVLIFQHSPPPTPPVLEVMPYGPQDRPDFRDPEAVGALVATRLNWYPAMLGMLTLLAREHANAPEQGSPTQRFVGARAVEIVRALEGA